MSLSRLILLAVALACPGAVLAEATVPTQDIAGAADPAWLKRYEGSYIVSYEKRRFDAVNFPASKLLPVPDQSDSHNNSVVAPRRKVTAEGAYTRLVYVLPEDRSPLEVIRGYIDEIKSGGGRLLYGCQDQACGGDLVGNNHGGGTQGLLEKLYPQKRVKDAEFGNGHCATTSDILEQRYLLARMGDGTVLGVLAYAIGNDLYCKAFNDRTGVLVVAVEPKAREKKMVAVSADEMAKALADDGRISLYGLYFDTNKSAVKPESRPTMEQIAALLKRQPTLSVDVVGHTDNVGGGAYNKGLSKRRADAVVAALVEDYGIDPSRVSPKGAGMDKPLAPNTDEAGRAKNRRVELVKR
ncbi:MAG TPA: OmpA family protein [Xanthomonadaceae bacterium]|nr:OmpA family protein [Xanthomonadaceae bacterium]